MTTSVVYYPHSIYLPGGISITQLSDVQPANNFQDLTEFAASEPAPQYTGSHQAAPDNHFSSTQIKTILDACIAGTYNLIRDFSVSENGGGTVQVEYRAGKNLDVRFAPSDSAHIRGNMQNNAALIWESLRVRQGGLAEIRCRLVAILNATTGADPLVFAAGVTLGASADVAHLFTLGKQAINGSTIAGVEEYEWNNNVEYEEAASDGDSFLTYIGVKKISPVLRLTTSDCSVMSTYTSRGVALTSLNSFLRKKLKSKINVADATAEHIRLQATTGTVKARELNGSKTMAVVEVAMTSSNTNVAPFSINTAIAIT